MVEVRLFHYHEGDTFLHRMHPLSKIVILLVLSFFLTGSSLVRTVVVAVVLSGVACTIRLPITGYGRELRFFFVMAMIIGSARAMGGASLVDVLEAVLGFATIVVMGILFADSTAPDDVARAVGALLSHIPKVPGYRIGATIELTLATIPLLFDAAWQISIARRARGESVWHHPMRRIVAYTSTVFALLLERAEILEAALQSRLYDPDAKRAGKRFGMIDMFSVGSTIVGVLTLGLFT